MSLYDRVRDLPLTVEGYALDGLEQQVSSGFLRKTTVIRLAGRRRGGRRRGRHLRRGRARPASRRAGPVLPLAGSWTIETFSRHLDDAAALRPRAGAARVSRLPPLGLRERRARSRAPPGRSARSARPSDATAEPLTFVVSMRLGEPATTDRLRAWLELYPGLRFKLDATPDWSDELIAELAATGAVDSVDFKGQYRGTVVDTVTRRRPLPARRRRAPGGVARGSRADPETEAVLEPHRDRVTWDAVIHSVADIEALRWPPRTVNVKPSRFGSVERLFAAYDYCDGQRDRRLRRRPVRARRRS